MNYVNRFRVAHGSTVKLKDIDPDFKDRRHESHKEAADEIEQDRTKLSELQELLYAEARCSLLICLQGMDNAPRLEVRRRARSPLVRTSAWRRP